MALCGYGGSSLRNIWEQPQFGTIPFVTEMFSKADMQMYHASITCYGHPEPELLLQQNGQDEQVEEAVEEEVAPAVPVISDENKEPSTNDEGVKVQS